MDENLQTITTLLFVHLKEYSWHSVSVGANLEMLDSLTVMFSIQLMHCIADKTITTFTCFL